jgi:peptide/nickel transport system substrate-binding protein
MKKFVYILLGLLAIGAMLLAACQPKATETPAVTQEASAPSAVPATAVAPSAVPPTAAPTELPAPTVVKGGTLNWYAGYVTSFDPPFIQDDASMQIASQVYSYLYRAWHDDQAFPDLAESWDFQEDGKVVIFHLRQGVFFQDGNDVFAEGQAREVKAADVVYSIERFITIEGGTAPSDLVQNFVSVEAVDDYTVKLTLSNPDALLFVNARGLTKCGILPKEAVDFYGENWPLNPIGSGSFEFVSYTPDDKVTLRPNEDARVVPNVDELVFKIIPDESVAAISLEAGDILEMSTSSSQIFDQFANNENFNTILGSCPTQYALDFDMTDPIIGKLEVRQAIAHAIDGQSIISAIAGGLYVPGCGVAGPGVPGYDPDLCSKYFAYDPTLAAQILTDAGWAKNASGIWEKDGTTLTFAAEYWNFSPMPDVATAVLTQLQEFGMDVTINQVEFGTWIDDYTTSGPGNPVMFDAGFCGDGGLNSLWGTSGLSYALGYSNTEAQTLLDSANFIIDPVERDKVLRQAQDLVYRDYPSYTLGFYVSGSEIVSKKVNDYFGANWFLNLTTDRNNVWLTP